MQYMLMFYENEAEIAASATTPNVPDPIGTPGTPMSMRCTRQASSIKEDPLRPPATATTVRLQAGKRLVQDGPVAATKEQLGGYVVIEVPDLDAALSWAARCPAASHGAVEVRPVLHLPTER